MYGLRLSLVSILAALLMGCSAQRIGGTTDVSGGRFRQSGDVGNVLSVDESGATVQRYTAESPAGAIVGLDGVENYGSVPFGTVSVSIPNGPTLIASVPNDFGADSVSVTLSDGTVVNLGNVRVSTSDVIVARATFIAQIAPVIAGWTAEQKQALLAQYEAQAALGDKFAEQLLPLIRVLAGGQ